MLGLSSIPPPLKSIAPYLQRAEEVKSQDPVIAYWCAYYAAQVGISLKAKDKQSRTLLLELLDVLEHTKKEIGANEALDVEVVSAAYVENFALKVFAVADNEDRNGEATRATAKKFLAAANFLEVLKIFPKSESLDSNDEKIRYAKWKAADIAKAFREGRKPLPGPAIPEVAESVEAEVPVLPSLTPPRSPRIAHSIPTPPKVPSPPAFTRHIPPPLSGISDTPEPQTPPRSAHLGVWGHENTPGSWSTVATPGTAHPPSDADDWRSRDAWMNSPTPDSLVPHEADGLSPTASRGSAKYMARSASVSPRSSGEHELPRSPISPKTIIKEALPVPGSPHAWDTDSASENVFQHPRLAAQPPADVPVDLTAAVIAKAQKHARFAISALDYEDHEQAKNELRTALAILGGR